MSRIYNTMQKQKQNSLNLKWKKDLNKHFPKEDVPMVKKHMMRSSITNH